MCVFWQEVGEQAPLADDGGLEEGRPLRRRLRLAEPAARGEDEDGGRGTERPPARIHLAVQWAHTA